MTVTCVQAPTPVKCATKLNESLKLNLSPIPSTKVGPKEARVSCECSVSVSIE